MRTKTGRSKAERFCTLRRRVLVATLACAFFGLAIASPRLDLLQPGSLDGWTARSFVGATQYQSVLLDGVHAVRAQAEASASGLYREGRVSLDEWPSLRWRWRVQASLPIVDERSREGEDFAARVYVITSHPLLFWKTRAICYVWAAGLQAGQDWPNPYTDSVHMVALNGVGDASGGWIEHERDVAADFKRYFGETLAHIDAVAVMTDTDQGGGRATAWYADLRFEGR
jgi:hypothetical protein